MPIPDSHPRAAPFLCAALLALTAAFAAPPAGVEAQADGYLDFDALTAELQALADGSSLVSLSSAGTSAEGREIWVAEIGDPSGAPLGERPAVLVVGNLSGDHLVGSSLALATIRHLVEGDAQDAARSEVLADRTVYVFPRLNPDGAEARFGSVQRDRRRNARPTDDDNDGRIDEDGAEDLDGDGAVTLMRVADPAGDYMTHPDDPRLMKRADPARGETGRWTLYREGTDDDGDGFIAEDGAGGVDLDRNFQHAYPYWEADAGPHMVSEPETRALMDFVIAHRNVAAILTFGPTDNLVTPPDDRGELAGPQEVQLAAFADASNDDVFEVGVFEEERGGFRFGFRGSPFRGAQPGRDNDPDSGRRPATTVNEDDLEYFRTVSEAYREITGIERVGVHRQPEGAFFQYGYFQFGVPSFSTPGWGLPEPEEEAGASPNGAPDVALLAGLEAAGVDDAFVPWTPFDHPTLGEVEIGGFRPYATTNPPADRLPELGRAHGEFLVRLAGMLPSVEFAGTEVEARGDGVFTVTAHVENAGYFPSALRHGVVAEAVHPVTVQLQLPEDDLITGDDKTSTIEKLDGSGRRESFTWVIRGQPGDRVEITVRAQKGGTDTTTVTLE